MADSTLEQAVLPLALLEVPCPECSGKGWWLYKEQLQAGCSNCGGSGGEADIVLGTGQVAEFKMLRKPCGCISKEQGACSECWAAKIKAGSQKAHSAACSGNGCQGRGWVPVTTTDALLEAAEEASWNVAFTAIGAPVDRWLVRLTARGTPDLVGVRGDWAFSRAEALAKALSAAKGIEVKK